MIEDPHTPPIAPSQAPDAPTQAPPNVLIQAPGAPTHAPHGAPPQAPHDAPPHAPTQAPGAPMEAPTHSDGPSAYPASMETRYTCADSIPTALPWWTHQQRWMEDHSRLRVCCKARQIGMSTAVATEALHAAIYGETTVVVSASQRQASELLRKAGQLLPLVTVAGDGVVQVEKQSAEAIELSTGGRVVSLPSTAATVQGYSGHVVIDEAAWIPDVDQLWLAIVPTISTNKQFRLSVISTPGPKSGMFHRLWHNGDQAWSRHKISVYDAKNGGAPHEIAALRAAVADEVTWRSAYECEFVDEAHALLPYDLLLARTDDTLNYHLSMNGLAEARNLFAGYDVGRKHDMSVLVVLEKDNKAVRWRGAVELRQTPFNEQFELLSSILKLSCLRRLSIDQSGLGMQLCEELVKKFGSRVEPVTMTAPVKESLASRILAAFQRGDLYIPNYRPLIDDLHSVARTVTLSGNVRYAAPREAGSHADRWTALALALEAADSAFCGPITISTGSPRPSAGFRTW
jgi:phage FluMu gp28-like protein